MSLDVAPPATPKWMYWTGWVLTILPVLLFAMSGIMKLSQSPQLTEGFAHLGWPVSLAIPLAVLELGCAVVFLIPQTAVVGAILLTGYLGGAIATHVRIGEGFVVQVILGIVIWLALFFRDARLRPLIPLRS